MAGSRKSYLRNSLLLIFTILVFSNFSYAELPSDFTPGKGYSCTSLCVQGNSACMSACVNPEYNLESLWAEERARCGPGCLAAEMACHVSCDAYWRISYDERPTPEDYNKIEEEYDSWDDYKKYLEEEEKRKQLEKEKEAEEEDDDLTVSRFVINAPSTFDLEKEESIEVDITAYGKDSKGVEKICAECSLGMWGVLNNRDKEAKEYMAFDVEMLNTWTDTSGKAKLRVTQKFVKINEKRVLKLYNTITKDNVYIDVIPKPKTDIAISSFKLMNAKGVVNQDSWGTFQVTVDDPDNRLKIYYISSNAPGYNWIKYEGVDHPEKAKIMTTSNTITFGWSSPKITEEVSMDYGLRLFETTMKIVAGELASQQADNVKNTLTTNQMFGRMASDGEVADFFIDKISNSITNSVGTANMAIDLLSPDPELKGQSIDYQIAKLLINSVANTRGVLSTIGKIDPTGASKVIDTGLTITQDLFAVVDDMTRLANAGEIARNYTVTVVVEDVDGKKMTMPAIEQVRVMGFSKVLKE